MTQKVTGFHFGVRALTRFRKKRKEKKLFVDHEICKKKSFVSFFGNTSLLSSPYFPLPLSRSYASVNYRHL